MATIYDVAAKFRRDLAALEDHAVWSMAASYDDVSASARRLVEDIAARIAGRLAEGNPVPVSWLYTEARLRDVVTDASRAFDAWAVQNATPAAVSAVSEATTLGPTAALEMIRARALGITPEVGASLVRLRQDEIAEMVGQIQDGPLRSLLRRAAGESASRIETALVEGVALSRDPRAVARDIAGDLAGGLKRARRIVRTEMMRSTREAQRAAYSANPMVSGWTWFSTLDRRTCAVCWAMHGTHFRLDEPFGSHPNCRCSMIPDISPPPGSGIQALPAIEPGPARFDRLPDDDKLRILGPTRFAAYQEGTGLAEFVAARDHQEWGATRFLRPIRAAAPPAAPPAPPAAAPPARSSTEPPPLAAATPVGERLEIFGASRGAKKEALAEVERAVKLLDDVIRFPLGLQEKLEVLHEYSAGRSLGAYQRREKRISREFVSSWVKISSRAIEYGPERVAATIVHELGHYMDFETLGAEIRTAGKRRAISAAEAAGAEFRASGLMPGSKMESAKEPLADWYAAANHQDLRDRVSREFFPGSDDHRYLLSPRELFARSFEQWVAKKTGDPGLLRVLADAPRLFRTNVYWTDREWPAVEAALDRFFERKGMLP